METMFDTTHGTTFVELVDVMVPVQNLIGKEGEGLKMLMVNFNHERFVIACQALRASRLCYSEGVHEALTRKTFGKRLIEHQIIRFKLAEMVRQIEALQAFVESVAYQFSKGVPDSALGSQCALLKVQASKTFEYCAREVVQIFGGSGLVKEGRGKIVERLYRSVRGLAIPGGSEGKIERHRSSAHNAVLTPCNPIEILLDSAIKWVVQSSL
jgi:alkylation response protein AidB-like acyl-CoA dehydrogenase